jgi:prepilin-type N-terminal cleavage/methylation domain-containing protein
VTGGGRGRRRAQRGFTLIELMVALVISSLLVGMIFAIFIRMSTAYRGQQQIAEVQSKLAAARAKIELDAKQAGFHMADGFFKAGLPPTFQRSPLRVVNNADGPDELELYYADASVQVATRAGVGSSCTRLSCDRLDSTAGFRVKDVVVMSTAKWVDLPDFSDGANIARFEACVLQIQSLGPTQLVFSTAAPWGTSDNSFCPYVPVPGTTIFYKLAARRWRIDPARPADGVLQLSGVGTLGGEFDDWQDQAYGFTDLQVATRFFEPDDGIDTPDPGSDARRDWYSGEEQESATAAAAGFPRVPIQISISLVARTERDVEGIASSSTPNLTVAGNEANNMIGDRAAIPLPSALDRLSGNRVFRYTTFQVDLRNLGVGR